MDAEALREHRELQYLRSAGVAGSAPSTRRRRRRKGLGGASPKAKKDYLRLRARKLRQLG